MVTSFAVTLKIVQKQVQRCTSRIVCLIRIGAIYPAGIGKPIFDLSISPIEEVIAPSLSCAGYLNSIQIDTLKPFSIKLQQIHRVNGICTILFQI